MRRRFGSGRAYGPRPALVLYATLWSKNRTAWNALASSSWDKANFPLSRRGLPHAHRHSHRLSHTAYPSRISCVWWPMGRRWR